MTATDRGLRIRATDRASARRARSAMAARASSVGSMGNSTSMTPSPKLLVTSKPTWRNTPSMRRLLGSTRAVKPLMPTSRAAAARYSSSTVAMPRPAWSSSVKKATSASDRVGWRS